MRTWKRENALKPLLLLVQCLASIGATRGEMQSAATVTKAASSIRSSRADGEFGGYKLADATSSPAISYCSGNSTATIKSCYDSLKPILDNPRLAGLPGSKEDVDRLCEGFQRGMKCIDDYAKTCLAKPQQAFLERTVQGARLTMDKLCNDLAFQTEYLKHTSCYKVLREEWEQCYDLMKTAVERDKDGQDKTRSEQEVLKVVCCAKYQFRVCTEQVAKKKCSPEAAVFLRNIAESLTEPMLQGKCLEVGTTVMQEATAKSGALKPSARSVAHRLLLPTEFPLALLALVALS